MDADKRIIQVYSNTNFNVNYDDGTLKPQIELILLTQQVNYNVNQKSGKIDKGWKVEEARFILSPDSIDELIGQLKVLSIGVNKFRHLASSINVIIKESTKEELEEKKEPKPL